MHPFCEYCGVWSMNDHQWEFLACGAGLRVVIQMVPAALTSVLMEPSSGRVAWTTLCDLGILEKEGNSSSMTSPLRSSAWVTVPLETGWQLGWRVPMSRSCIAQSQTSTNSTSMRAVCCLSNLPIVENGSAQQAKTTSSMPGAHPMEHPFLSQKRPHLFSAATSPLTTNTL